MQPLYGNYTIIMNQLIGDTYGLVHLISSVVALLAGTLVLLVKKGTSLHKRVGYVYVVSMVLLLVTAFLIYRLFDGWGVFHYASVFSLITISLGMIPIWTKSPSDNWRFMHFSFMYWSVIGLYSAFAAEVLTRIPDSSFFGMVGLSFLVIMVVAAVFFSAKRAKWAKRFGRG